MRCSRQKGQECSQEQSRKQRDVLEDSGALKGGHSTKPDIGRTDCCDQRDLPSLSPGGPCVPSEGIGCIRTAWCFCQDEKGTAV